MFSEFRSRRGNIKKNFFFLQITNIFRATRSCKHAWFFSSIRFLVDFFSVLLLTLLLFPTECHFNRLLCLSKWQSFSSVRFFCVNEIYFMPLQLFVTNFWCNCRMNSVLSLLTHINAYPCTICSRWMTTCFANQHTEVHMIFRWFLFYDTVYTREKFFKKMMQCV